MEKSKWERLIFSDPSHEHLVAKLYFEDKFVLLLNRENGRDHVEAEITNRDGGPAIKVPFDDLIRELELAKEDLNR